MVVGVHLGLTGLVVIATAAIPTLLALFSAGSGLGAVPVATVMTQCIDIVILIRSISAVVALADAGISSVTLLSAGGSSDNAVVELVLDGQRCLGQNAHIVCRDVHGVAVVLTALLGVMTHDHGELVLGKFAAQRFQLHLHLSAGVELVDGLLQQLDNRSLVDGTGHVAGEGFGDLFAGGEVDVLQQVLQLSDGSGELLVAADLGGQFFDHGLELVLDFLGQIQLVDLAEELGLDGFCICGTDSAEELLHHVHDFVGDLVAQFLLEGLKLLDDLVLDVLGADALNLLQDGFQNFGGLFGLVDAVEGSDHVVQSLEQLGIVHAVSIFNQSVDLLLHALGELAHVLLPVGRQVHIGLAAADGNGEVVKAVGVGNICEALALTAVDGVVGEIKRRSSLPDDHGTHGAAGSGHFAIGALDIHSVHGVGTGLGGSNGAVVALGVAVNANIGDSQLASGGGHDLAIDLDLNGHGLCLAVIVEEAVVVLLAAFIHEGDLGDGGHQHQRAGDGSGVVHDVVPVGQVGDLNISAGLGVLIQSLVDNEVQALINAQEQIADVGVGSAVQIILGSTLQSAFHHGAVGRQVKVIVLEESQDAVVILLGPVQVDPDAVGGDDQVAHAQSSLVVGVCGDGANDVCTHVLGQFQLNSNLDLELCALGQVLEDGIQSLDDGVHGVHVDTEAAQQAGNDFVIHDIHEALQQAVQAVQGQFAGQVNANLLQSFHQLAVHGQHNLGGVGQVGLVMSVQTHNQIDVLDVIGVGGDGVGVKLTHAVLAGLALHIDGDRSLDDGDSDGGGAGLVGVVAGIAQLNFILAHVLANDIGLDGDFGALNGVTFRIGNLGSDLGQQIFVGVALVDHFGVLAFERSLNAQIPQGDLGSSLHLCSAIGVSKPDGFFVLFTEVVGERQFLKDTLQDCLCTSLQDAKIVLFEEFINISVDVYVRTGNGPPGEVIGLAHNLIAAPVSSQILGDNAFGDALGSGGHLSGFLDLGDKLSRGLVLHAILFHFAVMGSDCHGAEGHSDGVAAVGGKGVSAFCAVHGVSSQVVAVVRFGNYADFGDLGGVVDHGAVLGELLAVHGHGTVAFDGNGDGLVLVVHVVAVGVGNPLGSQGQVRGDFVVGKVPLLVTVVPAFQSAILLGHAGRLSGLAVLGNFLRLNLAAAVAVEGNGEGGFAGDVDVNGEVLGNRPLVIRKGQSHSHIFSSGSVGLAGVRVELVNIGLGGNGSDHCIGAFVHFAHGGRVCDVVVCLMIVIVVIIAAVDLELNLAKKCFHRLSTGLIQLPLGSQGHALRDDSFKVPLFAILTEPANEAVAGSGGIVGLCNCVALKHGLGRHCGAAVAVKGDSVGGRFAENADGGLQIRSIIMVVSPCAVYIVQRENHIIAFSSVSDIIKIRGILCGILIGQQLHSHVIAAVVRSHAANFDAVSQHMILLVRVRARHILIIAEHINDIVVQHLIHNGILGGSDRGPLGSQRDVGSNRVSGEVPLNTVLVPAVKGEAVIGGVLGLGDGLAILDGSRGNSTAAVAVEDDGQGLELLHPSVLGDVAVIGVGLVTIEAVAILSVFMTADEFAISTGIIVVIVQCALKNTIDMIVTNHINSPLFSLEPLEKDTVLIRGLCNYIDDCAKPAAITNCSLMIGDFTYKGKGYSKPMLRMVFLGALYPASICAGVVAVTGMLLRMVCCAVKVIALVSVCMTIIVIFVHTGRNFCSVLVLKHPLIPFIRGIGRCNLFGGCASFCWVNRIRRENRHGEHAQHHDQCQSHAQQPFSARICHVYSPFLSYVGPSAPPSAGSTPARNGPVAGVRTPPKTSRRQRKTGAESQYKMIL